MNNPNPIEDAIAKTTADVFGKVFECIIDEMLSQALTGKGLSEEELNKIFSK